MDIIAHIDLNAINHNFEVAKELAQNSQVIPVIKANAYGHGAIRVAETLKDASIFAVARISEADELRRHGIKQSVLILSETWTLETLKHASEKNYYVVLHDLHTLELIEQNSLPLPLNTWLKIDTGMHRLGIHPDDSFTTVNRLKKNPNVNSICLMTHFATADASSCSFLEVQYAVFKDIQRDHPLLPCSVANSAALIRDNQYHADFVRPGIMLYGADPLFHLTRKPILECTMQLTAPVISIRYIHSGESVGYNRSWYAGRDSIIATIGIGYADGYPRHAKNGTPVSINGTIYPLVGTVSMDMILVDITDMDQHNVNVGDRAELWGQNVRINELALCSETIAYELFTSIGGRTLRQYNM